MENGLRRSRHSSARLPRTGLRCHWFRLRYILHQKLLPYFSKSLQNAVGFFGRFAFSEKLEKILIEKFGLQCIQQVLLPPEVIHQPHLSSPALWEFLQNLDDHSVISGVPSKDFLFL